MEDAKDDIGKKVDESWKDAVRQQKESGGKELPEMPEVTFSLFLSGLMMEGLIALGEVENPVIKKKELNKAHAKFIIDTLAMLDAKTQNNLSKDEKDTLDAVLYELRTRFVKKV